MVDGVRSSQTYIENIVEPAAAATPRVSQFYAENIMNPQLGVPRVSQFYVESIRSLEDKPPGLAAGVGRVNIVTTG